MAPSSAANDIQEAEENTKQIIKPVPENDEKLEKALPDVPDKEKHLIFKKNKEKHLTSTSTPMVLSSVDKPSTSAANEIREAKEENTKQIPSPVPHNDEKLEKALPDVPNKEKHLTSSSTPMASSSVDKPSTSAENEIQEAEDKTKKIPDPIPEEKAVRIKKKPSSFPKLFKSKSKKPKPTKENTPNQGEEAKKVEEAKKKVEEEAKKKVEEELKKEVEAISNSIRADLKSIENASKRFKKHEKTFEDAKGKFDELKDGNAKDLRELKKVIKTLKQKISTQDKDDPKEEEAFSNQLHAISIANAQEAKAFHLGMMPNLFADSDFEKTLQFKDFMARYNELPLELKLCLLCFSVFPEDVEIKRRVLVYWWIGEEFVPPRTVEPEAQHHWAKFDPFFKRCWDNFALEKTNPVTNTFTPEQWANLYFSILLEMGFIESAQKKPNPKVDTCKMHPFVRIMVNRIAQKASFYEFDGDGVVNGEFSRSLRACLLNGKKLAEDNLEKIHAIFNVDEAILDFKHDSLSKMRNANILHLGRWQNIGTHHIEIDDTKILNAKSGNILDGLQNIKNLKFLSFQGISRITELPKSVLKLINLTILDIRACHNLEKISNDIGCLVNLTHLDMSECYLLDQMPKGIGLLTNLQVLSGFVVLESENKNSCTLDDLKGFPHLRKLSIHTGSDKFPQKKDLEALNQFKALNKLTIAWGRGSANTERDYNFGKSTTLVKKVSDTGNQGHEDDNTTNEQTSKNETEHKKEADMGSSQENEQRSKKENKEEENKGKATIQNQGTSENFQESRKHDKGKGILKGTSREIINPPNAGIQEASGSRQGVVFSPEVKEKERNDKKPISKTQEAQSLERKKVSSSKFKTPKKNGCFELGRSLERTLTRRSTSRPPLLSLAELPSHLTKLDLQCLPEMPLTWLRPEKLLGLKKLYIRGGKLSDLGQFQDLEDDGFDKRKWENVEELRLKYLDELEMEWRELLELFPKLDYLEKVHCPKLSFFPCDEIGVWTKKKIIS